MTTAKAGAAASDGLRAAIDEYHDRQGQSIGFWWRDDDLICNGAALQHLSAVGARTGIAPLLAIIPGHANAALGETLAGLSCTAWLAQHGFVHANHERSGASSSEFGAARIGAAGLRDIAEGRAILLAMGLARFLDVFVPPWNHLDPTFLPLLPRLGITGVSGYVGHCGFLDDAALEAGLAARHAAVEVTRWGQRPEMLEAELLLARVTQLVRAGASQGTPLRIGILTHHRVMHGAEFDRLEGLFGTVSASPGCHWLEPPDVFA